MVQWVGMEKLREWLATLPGKVSVAIVVIVAVVMVWSALSTSPQDRAVESCKQLVRESAGSENTFVEVTFSSGDTAGWSVKGRLGAYNSGVESTSMYWECSTDGSGANPAITWSSNG